MLQPDASQDDEVVQVFTGDSLEQAMAYAVAALGPDLQVRRARKVRKGVAGLAGRDKYEVVAAPAETAPDADPVENAFDALLSQAEQAELPAELQRPVRRTTRPAPEQAAVPTPRPTPHPAPSVADHDEVLALVRARRAAPPSELELELEPTPAPEPEPEVVVVPEPVVVVAPPTAAPQAPAAPTSSVAKTPVATSPVAKRAPGAKRAPRAKSVPVPQPSGWSRAALVDLGVPEEVLAGLPADDPSDDLAWAAALAAAIATVLPAPAVLSEADPVVVDGHGVAGALGILRAAKLGLTPGTITTGTRTVPASAAELALVLRSAVIA